MWAVGRVGVSAARGVNSSFRPQETSSITQLAREEHADSTQKSFQGDLLALS